MKILYVSSECAPFSKSGGLADVAYSLPVALNKAGDECAVITPLYRCVRDRYQSSLEYVTEKLLRLGNKVVSFSLYRGENKGVRIWFLDCPEFYDRPRLYGYGDDAVRFAFFSHAVLDFMGDLEFQPEIIHCNDWESALTIVYLKDLQYSHENLRFIRTVFSIHNIAYQGQFGQEILHDVLGLDWGWYEGGMAYEYEGRHDINLMKCAMLMADAVSTVSPNYARELHSPKYGHGLQGVVDIVDSRLWGILNGIDMETYDPAADDTLPAKFSTADMSGKTVCKIYLQERFGLSREEKWPLLCSVARLVEQKGIELIKQVLPGLMDIGVQLIVFGQGDQEYVDYFRWAAQNWPGQVGFSDDYTEEMAKKVFAGSDMYLMPSRFEPCGLSQMMAMRYGTVPIVHETGGLKDSVRLYSDFDGQGEGFGFQEYSAKYLYLAVVEAVKLYLGAEDTFSLLRKRCMEKDLSWDLSAQKYQRMYGEICSDKTTERIPFEDGMNTLVELYRKIHEDNCQKHPERIRPGYRRVLQIRMTGRCDGVFSIRISDTGFEAIPRTVSDCDAQIECGYDNLLALATGEKDPDKLFMNGQLKVTGSMIKGHEFRDLLRVF